MRTSFTRKEKLLILVLAILLIGLIYYRFIHLGLGDRTAAATRNAEELQTEVDIAQARVAKIKKMDDEMSAGMMSRMGSYNNSKIETAFLHTVLSGVPNYSLTFSEVTREGDQIRRNFNLRFTAPSYSAATKIVGELTDGEFRCLIGDMSCSIDNGGTTTVSLNGTFYETMVGGVEDSALPVDSAEVDQPLS